MFKTGLIQLNIKVLLFILFSISLFNVNCFSQQQFTTERFTRDDGLPDNRIKHIFQDSKGFIWISTLEGIARYSGYEFKTYKHQPENLNSLSDYFVGHIFEDSSHNFWISTRTGVNYFNPKTEQFRHFFHSESDSTTLSSNRVVMTKADAFGNIWVGTRFGLNLFNPKSKTFKRYLSDNKSRIGIKSSYITDIFSDKDKNLWIGTEHGLYLYDYDKKIFNKYLIDSTDFSGFAKNRITNIFQTSKGDLLISTFKGVLKVTYNKMNGLIFIDYFQKYFGENIYSNIPIKQIAEDKKGNLWFATYSKGLLKFDKSGNKIYNYFSDAEEAPENNFNNIQSILIDSNNTLWIGTLENGLFKHSELNKKINIIENIFPEYEKNNLEIQSLLIDDKRNLWIGSDNAGLKIYLLDSIYNNKLVPSYLNKILSGKTGRSVLHINDIVEDNKGEIWIATLGNGLLRFNPQNNKLKTYLYNPDDPNSLRDNYIHDLFIDSQNYIWLGTARKGIIKLNPTTDEFENFSADPKYYNHPRFISEGEVVSINEDKNGYLWIGTTDGLSIFDKDSKIFTHLRHIHQDAKTISSNYISTICMDGKNRIWIGTFDGGLNLFNPKDTSFKKYSEQNLLPDNTILNLVEDNKNNIFIKTNNGITRYNPNTEEIKFYDDFKEKIKLSISPYADVFDHKSAKILWGGDNKIFIFNLNSDSIGLKNSAPLVLTKFKIFGKEHFVQSNDGDTINISYAKEFFLPYDENFITFEFALLDFTNPSKNKYAYMLEGFDNDWIYSGNKREVTYTNLDPGNYIFRVKAANSDGIWSEGVLSVKLTISPPLWKTWWAYGFYAIVFLFGLYFIRKYELNRIKLREDLRYKEFESQKLLEVYKIKTNFFANISHEFRTPLTIILGSIEKLQEKIDNSDDLKEIKIMKRNANRLLYLVNQLLELAKIDAGKVNLNTSEGDLVSLLFRIVSSFESLANRKNITINFNGLPLDKFQPSEEIPVFFDRKKLEIVFYNLLSNAVKFTPENHSIDIRITKENEFAKIEFENTGIEIPKENIERIFSRFFQVNEIARGQFEGTGIGLALVKEYIELHKGKVEVKSNDNKTIFSVYLPLGKSHLNENEIIDSEEYEISDDIILPASLTDETIFVEENELEDSNKPIILLIEDNSDLRNMIKDLLEESYKIILAGNGAEGLMLAEEHIPDLILSDIMMPEMDGYEVAKRLKMNEKTDHIPIILLTARAAIEDKLDGLSIGVDDYIIKPFNRKELELRIRNIIQSRMQLREKYLAQSLVNPGSVVIPSQQKQFIEKLKTIINAHLRDDNFSVELLCNEIGMSRTQLHRKIKSVTNQSTTEFIRNYRLQLAAELLKQDAGNIAEISNKVGFNSQAYFTKLFQELYGITPLEYKKKHS